jgi:hypothetical protein
VRAAGRGLGKESGTPSEASARREAGGDHRDENSSSQLPTTGYYCIARKSAQSLLDFLLLGGHFVLTIEHRGGPSHAS